MVFNTPIFLFLFLPLCLGIYFLVPWRFRNVVLLLASLLFYSWGEPQAVAVMLISIASNYGFGRWLENARNDAATERTLRRIVAFAITSNLLLFIAFKYTNWLWSQAQSVLTAVGVEAAADWNLRHIPLPIGISFFTFQAMSYVVDIYRRQGEAQRRPVDFALYIALFPQLIAGPIVRYRDIAVQIRSRRVTGADFAEGVRRFLIGLGKKVLIADLVALPADQIFETVPHDQLSASVAWLAIICYTLQLYFDFSGYSDMAIGLSRMFGFHLLENFRWPYISRSITEFWQRWHISLSSWFRDYLYIPMGGNRRGSARTYFNLMTVFFLCGLWHGSSWTYVIFGLYHGMLLIVERAGLSKGLLRIPRVFQHAYMLLVLMLGFVIFRAPNLPEAIRFWGALFGFGAPATFQTVDIFLDRELTIVLLFGLIGTMPWVDNVWKWRNRQAERGTSRGLCNLYDLSELCVLIAVLALVAIQVSASRYSPFIYFRF